MPRAYLTIDDTPSGDTGKLAAWLAERQIPALLFCRGDRLAINPEPVVNAIRLGFVIGNHAWSHIRFSQLSLEEGIAEIERTESLIEAAYAEAGCVRPGKYFRFPHMDRGAGGFIVDYDAVPEHRETLIRLFSEGLNIEIKKTDAAALEKKQCLQDWLAAQGFTPPPFAGVTHSWYADTELAQAVDAMFTYSTADWMVTPRHAGKWPYRTLSDLRKKIDDDVYLWREDSAHIILMHDQDDLFRVTSELLVHIIDKGMRFAPVAVQEEEVS